MDKKLPLTIVLLLVLFSALSSHAADPAPITLNWLDQVPPPTPEGVSWGVPFPKATVTKEQTFSLKSGNQNLPLQSWPLAYWPDGSMKWIGFATTATPQTAGPLQLSLGNSVVPSSSVQATQTDQSIDVNTGTFQTHISRQGQNLFDSLTLAGRPIAQNARLQCLLQTGPDLDTAANTPRQSFTSIIKKMTLEQSGPVRAVVKIEGMHKADTGSREFLPFVVRLYFYAGDNPIRMVHTFFFDGNEKQDFIRGLGITFSVPMREEIQNRHVRFGGEGDGLWSEPIQPATGYQGGVNYPNGGGNVYADQVAGKPIPNKKDLDPRSAHLFDAWASWDDFRVVQPNAHGFTVEKRTNPKSAWIAAGSGTRASGLAFAGDTSGGLAVALKDFWQSYPTSLEVLHAKSSAAQINVWLWSPDAPAMDMRHYDTVAHGLNESYEDVEEGLSTPFGMARTHELTLFPSAAVPSKEEMSKQSHAAAQPPVLVATPQYLHDVRAFGIWSLQDRSTPFKKAVEDQLDANIAYYQKGIEQWSWYGFWDFGDIMHSYDNARHTWRYDIGGFAWDNDEQGTDMWLWYSFLRTGRADIFRMAEAMSRHTGEVDCYHFGPLAGLGSRHNVRHWGDGAKEARISMAPYRRFYYYLTTDERTGDVMREMLQSESAITRIDPMRKVLPPVESDKQFPARVRAGPDWFAFAGNWMTEYERTLDPKWINKVNTSIDSIAAMPFWFTTSTQLLWGFFPETGKLVARENIKGGYNLVNNMGGPETMMEFNESITHEPWQKIYLQYCRLASAPADVITADKASGTEGATGQYAGGGRMAGYAYYITKNPAYAQRAIGGITPRPVTPAHDVPIPEALKPIHESSNYFGIITNTINQNSLQAIEVLELCRDQLPTEVPAAPAGGAGGRGGRGRGGRGAGVPATQPAAPAE